MKINRRNAFTLGVLEILGHLSLTTVDLLDRLTTGGKYLSKKHYKGLMKRISQRHEELDMSLEEIRSKQNFYSLLYHLQKSGLIEKRKRNKRTFWSITQEGKERKDLLTAKEIKSSFGVRYAPEPSQHTVIVIFDIPETEKHKREWLRSVLTNLQFKLLQRSVWIGESKIPLELINDLKELNLLSCVKVFSVLEKGNI